MKPLLLEIDGLGSFDSLQTIDFEVLTSSGLFGIFGKTGAGKSTILDSLTLALYNNVDRYIGDQKSEMVNINRKDCYVGLTFSVKSKGEDTIYKVERSFRIDPHGKLMIKKHILSVKSGDIYEPVADGATNVNNKLLEIICLTYEDFTKAVILPQGKFNQFINLGSNEKREMLERIFGLEQYGQKLTIRYNEKRKQVETDYKVISEKVKVYEEYTEKNKKEVEKTLKAIEKELKETNKTLKENIGRKAELEKDINNATSLQKNKADLVKLENLASDIEKDKQTLKNKDLITKVNELENKNIEYKNKLKTLEEEKLLILNSQEKLTQGFNNIETKFKLSSENINENKKNLSNINIDTNYALEITKGFNLENELSVVVGNINKGVADIENNNVKIKTLKEDIVNNNKEVESLKALITQTKTQLEDTKKDREYWDSCVKVVNKHVNNNTRFEDVSEKVYISFDEQIANILNADINIKKYQDEILEFKMQNSAMELAKKLVDGEPCPVCGSKVHPNIVKILEDGFEELKQKQISECEQTKVNAKVKIEEYSKGLEKRINSFKTKVIELEKELETLTNKLRPLEDKTTKNNSDIENLEKNNTTILENNKEFKITEESLIKTLEVLKVKHNLKTTFKEENSKVQESQLVVEKLRKTIESLEAELKDLTEQKANVQEKLNQENLKLISNKTIIEEVSRNKTLLDGEINEFLVSNGLSIEIIESLKTIDFDLIANRVENYNNQLVITKNKYEELKAFEVLVLEDLSLENKTLVELIESLEKAIEEKTTLKGTLGEKINTFEVKLQEKALIEDEVKALTKEYDNILSLKSLLQGKKFIEFIARKDLEEVVYFASSEFNKLSNGKYYLKLSDDSLDIEVVDNLQGGKCRSIKSLSGGETFIISLCLSLSLSKKIQMKKNSIIEFFFLDEGFGSLDNDALENVTDSLMGLKNNDINIGIITHVDKLKEKVPRTLYVENTANGTKVRIG